MTHLSPDSLMARARRHVLENGPSGELYACALFGRQADRMAAFAEKWAGRSAVLDSFDASSDLMLAMRVSGEGEHLFLAAVYAKSGDVRQVGDLEVSDMDWAATMPQPVFERIVAPLSSLGVETVDQVDPYDVVDCLCENSVELPLGAMVPHHTWI